MPAGHTIHRPLAAPRWLNAGAGLAAVGLGLLLLTGTLLRPINFDERIHVNFLWLITQGLRPHVDFWCSYPAAGYALFRPVLDSIPQNAADLIVLRLCAALLVAASFAVACAWSAKLSGCWWLPLLPAVLLVSADQTYTGGLARVLVEFRTDSLALLLAFVALALLFCDARGGKRALAAACAVISLAVMPKYLYVLAAVYVIELIGQLRDRRFRWGNIFFSLIGALAGLLATWLLLFYANTNFGDTWRWAFLLQKNWQAHAILAGPPLTSFTPNLLWPFLLDDYAMTACLAAGLGAFLIYAHRQNWRGQPIWVGCGLLAGVLVTVWQTRLHFDQYLAPILLPLVFFFPFVGPLLPAGRRQIWAQGALLAVLALALFASLLGVAQKLSRTTLFDDLALENHLHATIPQEQRTLGAFPLLFRFPLTFLTYDEQWGEPPGYESVIPSDSPVAREFTAAPLAEALRAHPPALIQITHNLPVSWKPVIQSFLHDHADAYQCVIIRDQTDYIRRDLYQAHPIGTPSTTAPSG
jgi:hypothetical protein